MIRLTIGTNTTRRTVTVDPTETLEEVLSANQVGYQNTALHLNGNLIAGVDVECTFEELGIADNTEAMLITVVKANSAK